MNSTEKLIPQSHKAKDVMVGNPCELEEILKNAVAITIQPCKLLHDGAWYLVSEHWGALQETLKKVPGETEI